jgi:SAM-dependent methyltransferase
MLMSTWHFPESPSPWVVRFAPLIPPRTQALDLACGAGRHAKLLASLGHRTLAVDRDLSRLGDVAMLPLVETFQADLESGDWPLQGRQFGGIVVTNYLHRPLFPHLLAALQPSGVLIYETFARGNERFGGVSNPDFLLLPGELLDAVRGLARVVAYEDVVVDQPKPAAIQHICAVRN